MRIQLILPGLSVGGTEKIVTFLARGFKERGHEVQVISLKRQGPMAEILRSAGVDVITLNTPEGIIAGLLDTRRLFRSLKTVMRAFKPDVVQSFLTRANVLVRAAGRQLGLQPIVCSLRVMEQQKKFHLWAERWFQDSGITYTTNSDLLKQFAVETMGLDSSRIHVIHNGVEPLRAVSHEEITTLRERHGLSGHKIVLAAGRLHSQKGFDLLIKAFAKVLIKEPEARLIIAGEGEDRSLLERLATLEGLDQKIVFAGLVRDMAPYFRLATIFVLSSRWEGTPNVLLESMIAGCPVVATRVGGVTEVLTTTEQGILIPPNDIDALAQGITNALSHPEMGRQHAEAARIRTAAYSMSGMIQAYESLYFRELS